jgi:hypothetical protein
MEKNSSAYSAALLTVVLLFWWASLDVGVELWGRCFPAGDMVIFKSVLFSSFGATSLFVLVFKVVIVDCCLRGDVERDLLCTGGSKLSTNESQKLNKTRKVIGNVC